ncbi:MAG: hypothetical protein IPJ88_13650 [Myxococcales bacterium]|nr:MAG: hypothetical protein IPJ88_13650 [Myxococcales bacterium]
MRNSAKKMFTVWLLLFCFVGAPLAFAQKGRSKPRVIQLEEIKIEGRVQKPNAFYILNRSNIGYEVLDLKTSFVREVVRSVDKQPF